MNQQYPNPPFEQNIKRPVAVVNMPQTAWQSTPATVRFAVWVWAVSVIASLAGAVILLVLFTIGINAAMLGGGN